MLIEKIFYQRSYQIKTAIMRHIMKQEGECVNIMFLWVNNNWQKQVHVLVI